MNKEKLLYNYFSDSLTKDEKDMLNNLLKSDSKFKTQFDFENKLKKVVTDKKSNQLKNKLKEFESGINSSTPKSNNSSSKKLIYSWKNLGVAASILLFFTFGFQYYISNKNANDLFTNNFYKYPNTLHPNLKSNNTNENSNEIKAFRAYDLDNDNKAIELFENSIEKNNDENIYFYLGQSYLSIGKADKAIKSFKKSLESNEKYIEEIEWYLALAFIKKKDFESAKYHLNTVIKNNSYKNSTAKKLLKEIK